MTNGPYLPGNITLKRTYIATCGKCLIDGYTVADTKHDAEKRLRHRGWVKTHDYGWLCDYCQERKE